MKGLKSIVAFGWLAVSVVGLVLAVRRTYESILRE